ncbi:MAG: T9SS type A sorting domain-containing protein, partial [bacterium]|nr:T9SS type A sorting domain-containing protein [bacterium]
RIIYHSLGYNEDVFENVEVFDDFEIGYDPLIKSVKVAPNPNNGEFFLIITLREVNDVVLRMTDVAGSKVMDRVLSGADYYNEKIDIGKSGIFILTLTVGDEIKSIKILSVK